MKEKVDNLVSKDTELPEMEECDNNQHVAFASWKHVTFGNGYVTLHAIKNKKYGLIKIKPPYRLDVPSSTCLINKKKSMIQKGNRGINVNCIGKNIINVPNLNSLLSFIGFIKSSYKYVEWKDVIFCDGYVSIKNRDREGNVEMYSLTYKTDLSKRKFRNANKAFIYKMRSFLIFINNKNVEMCDKEYFCQTLQLISKVCEDAAIQQQEAKIVGGNINGAFTLTSDHIRLDDGYFLITHPRYDNESNRYFQVDYPYSRKAFNVAKSSPLCQIPSLKVSCLNGRISKVMNLKEIEDAIYWLKCHFKEDEKTTAKSINRGYKEDGTVMIPWEYVQFFNRYIEIRHPNHVVTDNLHRPYKHPCSSSKSIFNNVAAAFSDNVPPIKTICINGNVQKVVEPIILERYIISLDKHATELELIKTEPVGEVINPCKALVGNSNYSNNDIIKALKIIKSKTLQKLSTMALPSYKMYYCLEVRLNSYGNSADENAFMFVVKASNVMINVVYENVNISRATIVFHVWRYDFDRAIDAIYRFFASNQENKREHIEQGKVNFSAYGIRSYERIFHHNYEGWRSRLLEATEVLY